MGRQGVSLGVERLQIAPGTEGAAGAGEEHRPDFPILVAADGRVHEIRARLRSRALLASGRSMTIRATPSSTPNVSVSKRMGPPFVVRVLPFASSGSRAASSGPPSARAGGSRPRQLANRILDLEPKTFIIFQTAYEEYAIEAFKAGGVDYILKPTTKQSIEKSIDKVKKYLQTNPDAEAKKIMGEKGK